MRSVPLHVHLGSFACSSVEASRRPEDALLCAKTAQLWAGRGFCGMAVPDGSLRVKLEAPCLQTEGPLMRVVHRRHAAEDPLHALEECQTGFKAISQTRAAPMTAPAMEVRALVRCMPARILTTKPLLISLKTSHAACVQGPAKCGAIRHL